MLDRVKSISVLSAPTAVEALITGQAGVSFQSIADDCGNDRGDRGDLDRLVRLGRFMYRGRKLNNWTSVNRYSLVVSSSYSY